MHINPRFEARGDKNTVVCNSYQGGRWCEAVRQGGFPFSKGAEFKVRTVCAHCNPATRVSADRQSVLYLFLFN